MFDAYTIKKVFPRLAIAVVLIQLSWPLFTLFITLVSNIAWGIEGLLYAPFGGRTNLEIGNILETATGNAGFATMGIGALAAIIGGTIGAIALGGIGLLSLATSIILALMIGFFVLAVRQVLIVVLLVISPLALAAWILPGTEKFWKIWWESFSKALLMYPLILLLIAGGRIAAHIAALPGTTDAGPEAFKLAIVLLAFFSPYFLIPKTFQVAGSAFANIAGIANDRGRGVFDRLKKGRQERMADRFKRAQDNHLWNNNSAVGRRANTVASWLTDPMKNSQVALGTKKGMRYRSQIAAERAGQTEKLAEATQSMFNDKANRALTQWDGTKEHMDKIIEQLAASDDGNDRIGAKQLKDNAGFLYAYHDNPDYGRASIAGAAGLNLAQQGFIQPDELVTIANGLDSEIPGLGAMMKTKMELLGGRSGAGTKPGYTAVIGSDGEWAAGGMKQQVSYAKKAGTQDIGSMKADKLLALKDAYVESISGGTDSEGKRWADPDIAKEMENTLYQAYGSYTNPSDRAAVKEILMDAKVAAEARSTGRTVDQLSADEVGALRQEVQKQLDYVARIGPSTNDMNNPAASAAEDNK